jgi:dephospho-CoA kinase
VLGRIVECFGRELLDEQGALRRGALADRVFRNANERLQLEALLHPPIREAWRRQLESWRAEGRTAGVVVIPLLYETNCETELEAVICTACSAVTQRDRLHQRGWSDSQIDGRLAAQLPLKTKMERADFVIWCEGGLAATEHQVKAVWERLGL